MTSYPHSTISVWRRQTFKNGKKGWAWGWWAAVEFENHPTVSSHGESNTKAQAVSAAQSFTTTTSKEN